MLKWGTDNNHVYEIDLFSNEVTYPENSPIYLRLKDEGKLIFPVYGPDTKEITNGFTLSNRPIVQQAEARKIKIMNDKQILELTKTRASWFWFDLK